MSFTPKTWQNEPSHATPLGASGLNDLEDRIDDGFTDAAAEAAAAQAASQPLDSDLTAIAALSTTSFGRAFLALADAAAARTAISAAAATHTHAESDVTNLVSDLAAKAPLASPALTGHPTGVTESANDNSTRLATTAYADAVKAALAGTYKVLSRTSGRWTTAGAASTDYVVAANNSDIVVASNFVTAASGSGVYGFYFDDADYTLAGLTQKLNLRVSVLTPNTAPAQTFTFTLKPLTISAGNGVAGTTVSGSTVTHTTPAANAVTTAVSGDFTIPADGFYYVNYTISGTPSSAGDIQVALLTRYV